MKKRISFLAAIAMIIWIGLAVACSSASLPPTNVDSEGIALKGYDPVAYFTVGKPVKGQKEFQLTWDSAKWLFANQSHLDMFRNNPEKFAPQYGGY